MKAKKSHSKKGARKTKHRKGHKKHLRGLGAAGATVVAVAKDTLNPLVILAGYAVGAFGGRMLDKVAAITPDPAGTGFQAKSLIKPGILLVTGIAVSGIAHHMGSKSQKPSMGITLIKNFGYGVIVSGGVSLVKGVIKKDLFTGLGASGTVDANYLSETKDVLRKIMENASKQLVELPGGNQNPELNGGQGLYTPTLDLQEMETIV